MPDFNKETGSGKPEPLFVFFGHLGAPPTKSGLSEEEGSK